MKAQTRESVAELLQKSHYTLDELADLLEISPFVIRHEAREGHLKAFIVDHHVLSIRREDAIDWMSRRY